MNNFPFVGQRQRFLAIRISAFVAYRSLFIRIGRLGSMRKEMDIKILNRYVKKVIGKTTMEYSITEMRYTTNDKGKPLNRMINISNKAFHERYPFAWNITIQDKNGKFDIKKFVELASKDQTRRYLDSIGIIEDYFIDKTVDRILNKIKKKEKEYWIEMFEESIIKN